MPRKPGKPTKRPSREESPFEAALRQKEPWDGADLAAVARLTALWEADAKRFGAENPSDDDLALAAGYWACYPFWIEQLGDNPWRREPERYAAYNALVHVHLTATQALMTAARAHGIDSAPLCESADLCRRLFAEPNGKYCVRRASAVGGDDWPECLDACAAEIAVERVDRAYRGRATLMDLSAALDIKTKKPALLQAVTANGERDKWLYESCCQGVKYETIKRQLADKKSWEPIDSIQGIKLAANRHAKARGLAPIPSRQPGRRPRKG